MCRPKHVSDEVKVEHVDPALSANAGVPCHCCRYKLYCVSCSACQKNQRWRGAAAYTSNSKTLTMQKRNSTSGEGAREGAREGVANRCKIAELTVDLTKRIRESWPEEARVPIM